MLTVRLTCEGQEEDKHVCHASLQDHSGTTERLSEVRPDAGSQIDRLQPMRVMLLAWTYPPSQPSTLFPMQSLGDGSFQGKEVREVEYSFTIWAVVFSSTHLQNVIMGRMKTKS